MARKRRKVFAEIYLGVEEEIRKLSRSPRQYIPGMEPDDIEAEMIACLWKARRTYDKSKGTTLMQYWWPIWIHRRADLIDYALYKRRDYHREVLTPNETLAEFGLTVTPADLMVLELPDGYTLTEKRIWRLIASGMDPVIISRFVGRRTYELFMEIWREDPTIMVLLQHG